MKILASKKLDDIAAALAQASTPDESLPLQVRYAQLLRQVISFRKQVDDLVHPKRNEEELEIDMLSVRQFTASMTPEVGAVTCAGIYNVRFFELDGDRPFIKLVCKHLVAVYAKAAILIEPTYKLWQHLADEI